MTTQFKSIIQLVDFFKEESNCIEYLSNARWNGQAICLHRSSAKVPYITN